MILYFCLIGFPLALVVLKIKNKEFDEPKLFVYVVIWIIAISFFWYHFDLFNADYKPFRDEDFIWKK